MALAITMLLTLAIGGLGLGFVGLAQWHSRAATAGRRALALGYAAENGIKTGVRDLLARLETAGTWRVLEEGRTEALRAAADAGGAAVVEAALAVPLPLSSETEWESWRWSSSVAARLASVTDGDGWFSTRNLVSVAASGRLRGAGGPREAEASIEAVVAAGRLPLSLVPFQLAAKLEAGELARVLEDRNIRLLAAPGSLARPAPLVTESSLVPEVSLPVLERGLRVKLFKPQDLSTEKLRLALGLEPGAGPVPDGVYLVRDDLGLGGVYVRGDLEELVAAVDGDEQVLGFRAEAGEWRLRFAPSRCRTVFRTPSETFEYDLLPQGIVIVDGEVRAFGGGVVDADGRPALSADPEVPAILSGVQLTLVTSGPVTIASHLAAQGVRRQAGIPYLKDSKTQLVIWSTGRETTGAASTEAGIVVGEGAPSEIKIQASLAAKGAGLTIKGRGKTVEILGGLAADGYESGGNALAVVPDGRGAGGGGDPGAGPASASPLLAVVSLRALDWKEARRVP